MLGQGGMSGGGVGEGSYVLYIRQELLWCCCSFMELVRGSDERYFLVLTFFILIILDI